MICATSFCFGSTRWGTIIMIGMKKRIGMAAALVIAATVGYATPAAAQATRTWVSGVGDDVNPCSRTAPCKTFAGAISKTAAGGEINCLDPGGFGAVNITKSLTIDCHYTEGGALAGGSGIIVNLPAATDVVFIRGLDLFGVNPPLDGMRVIGQGALHVEDTIIRRFNAASSRGISFKPSGNMKLFLSNVTIAENGSAATGGGILIQPTGTASASVSMRNVRIRDNANDGIRVDSTANTNARNTILIDDSDISGNTNGINVLDANGTTGHNIFVRGSSIIKNTIGILASGGAAVMRVSDTVIAGNATGIQQLLGATIFSYGDNLLDANPDNVGVTNNGAFTGVIQAKK
jgi:hypothetical protein